MKTTKLLYSSLVVLMLCCMQGCKKSDNAGEQPPPADEVITYEPSAAIFPNPERGFIKTYIVKSEAAGLAQTELNLLRGQNISLILRLFYFDQFKDRPLSDAELNLMRADLTKIRAAGLKTILRFAYTDQIGGTDAPLSIVRQHLDQLKPVFEENQDVIAFVQAGFIGAWGEWHSSSNGLATVENQRMVLEKLLEVVPSDIMVQVRTPAQKQEVLNTTAAVTSTEAYTNMAKARVGHHNDCFLSGGDDYGTYKDVALEKDYISKEALYVPTGGETCPPMGGFDPTCLASRTEMKLLKWTYLNLDWYPATISGWKSSGCFDEFHTYLGYRFSLVEGSFPSQLTSGGTLNVALSIINTGYAPLYSKKTAVLVLKNKTTGTFHEVPLQADLRTVKPGPTVEIKEAVTLAGIPAGNYALYLRIADRSPSISSRVEYAIRLANNNGWVEEHGGMNDLKHDLAIQ